jgi:hypothetical protein
MAPKVFGKMPKEKENLKLKRRIKKGEKFFRTGS